MTASADKRTALVNFMVVECYSKTVVVVIAKANIEPKRMVRRKVE